MERSKYRFGRYTFEGIRMSTIRNTLTTSMTLASVSLLSSAIASAQPAPSTQPVPAAAPPPAPIYQPVAPTQPPAPVVTAQPKAATVEVPDAPATARPQGLTFGLGLGYYLNGSAFENGNGQAPVNLKSPTGASVQVRLASGLTLAPFFRLATHGQSSQGGDAKNAQNEFIVGSEVRYPLKSRGKVDLVAVGNASLGVLGNDPDMDDNNSTLTGFSVGYGLSVEYWYNSNWRLSFTATNPLFALSSLSQEVSDDLTATDIDVGLIWDPDTNLALHLFF